MRRNGFCVTLVTIVLAGFCVAADAPNVSVKLKKIAEDRELTLEKSEDSFPDSGDVTLTLLVDGQDVVGARKAGRIKVTKAVDDKDTDLLAKPKGVSVFSGGDDFREIMRRGAFFKRQKEQKEPTAFDVDVLLPNQAARAASQIKLVEGSFQVLVGGEKKQLTFKIKDHIGKELNEPALKDLAISFKMLEPTKAVRQGGGSLPVEIKGDLGLLDEVEIETGDGEKINDGMMTVTGLGMKSQSYSLRKPIEADTVLKITVYAGQKVVTVPFKFENLKLP
jgi:hypothetical protein